MRYSILILFIINLNLSIAQDTICLVTGKKIILKEYKIDNFQRKLFYKTKKNKEKSYFLDNIFSIIDTLEKETIIYNPSTNLDFDISVENMRDFVQGASYARQTYKAPLFTIYGFVTGTAYTVLLQNPVYAILPSGGTSVLLGLPKKSSKRIAKKYPEYADNIHYIKGYNQEVKNKRFMNSVKGAGLGILTGIAAIILQQNNILLDITF